ncbi:hypothetical protein ACYOEI_00355 [Singulisphaera rosea]
MDWGQIDLTLEAVIGGDYQPNMLSWEQRRDRHSDLYMELFRGDREGILMIVDDHDLDRGPIIDREFAGFAEENAANSFMGIFNRFPAWAKTKWDFLNRAMSGGDQCDRCGITMNLLNSASLGCCDKCEIEMAEEIAARPDVVFAFESGTLIAVA